MKKILIFLKNEIVYNGHLQTIGTIGIIVFSSIMLGFKMPWHSLAIAYLLFYLIYYNDRHIDCCKDGKGERTDHIKKLKKYASLIYASNIILSLILILRHQLHNPIFIIFYFLTLICGLIYPVWAKPLTKKITGFKNYYVASVFALMVFWQPFYNADAPKNWFLAWTIFFLIFFKAINMQIFLDQKDIPEDQHNGIKTLAAKWGPQKTQKNLFINNIIFCFLVFILFYIITANAIIATIIAILPLIYFILSEFLFLKKSKLYKKIALIMESVEFSWWPLIFFI